MGSIEQGPAHELPHKFPFVGSNLSPSHLLELVRVIKQSLLLWLVVDEVSVFGIPVSDEVEWLVFEAYEHWCI